MSYGCYNCNCEKCVIKFYKKKLSSQGLKQCKVCEEVLELEKYFDKLCVTKTGSICYKAVCSDCTVILKKRRNYERKQRDIELIKQIREDIKNPDKKEIIESEKKEIIESEKEEGKPKRPRGRPKKIRNESEKEHDKPKRPRGRPKKIRNVSE